MHSSGTGRYAFSYVNVYLDRAFGGFMFQDPNAPAPPQVTNTNLLLYRLNVALVAQTGLINQALSRPGFRDVGAGSSQREAIALLSSLGFMSGFSGNMFKPNAALTRTQMATALAKAVHRTSARTLKLTTGSTSGKKKQVTEGLLEKALVKALKINVGTAMSYLHGAFPHFSANRGVIRGQGAQVLFASVGGHCLQGCAYTKITPPAIPVADTVSVAAGPTQGTTVQGGKVSTTITTDQVSGAKHTMKLFVRGLPSGVSASFKHSTLAAGAASTTLTLNTGAGTPAATYTITITAQSGAKSGSTTYALTVAPKQVATQFLQYACDSSGPTNISCNGMLSTGSDPASGGSPLGGRLVTLTYAPPGSGPPSFHTVHTAGDGSFTDSISGQPLTGGTWQVQARYAGDAATKPANGTQGVFVQSP